MSLFRIGSSRDLHHRMASVGNYPAPDHHGPGSKRLVTRFSPHGATGSRIVLEMEGGDHPGGIRVLSLSCTVHRVPDIKCVHNPERKGAPGDIVSCFVRLWEGTLPPVVSDVSRGGRGECGVIARVGPLLSPPFSPTRGKRRNRHNRRKRNRREKRQCAPY